MACCVVTRRARKYFGHAGVVKPANPRPQESGVTHEDTWGLAKEGL